MKDKVIVYVVVISLSISCIISKDLRGSLALELKIHFLCFLVEATLVSVYYTTEVEWDRKQVYGGFALRSAFRYYGSGRISCSWQNKRSEVRISSSRGEGCAT